MSSAPSSMRGPPSSTSASGLLPCTRSCESARLTVSCACVVVSRKPRSAHSKRGIFSASSVVRSGCATLVSMPSAVPFRRYSLHLSSGADTTVLKTVRPDLCIDETTTFSALIERSRTSAVTSPLTRSARLSMPSERPSSRPSMRANSMRPVATSNNRRPLSCSRASTPAAGASTRALATSGLATPSAKRPSSICRSCKLPRCQTSSSFHCSVAWLRRRLSRSTFADSMAATSRARSSTLVLPSLKRTICARRPSTSALSMCRCPRSSGSQAIVTRALSMLANSRALRRWLSEALPLSRPSLGK